MICNGSLTVYHKGFDKTVREETWTRFYYANVWFFGGEGARLNKGFDNANDVQIRIPYGQNEDLDFGNFAIGDIVVEGTLDTDIQTQQDLDGTLFYNIKSLNNNTFGNNPHIHIGGR